LNFGLSAYKNLDQKANQKRTTNWTNKELQQGQAIFNADPDITAENGMFAPVSSASQRSAAQT
jgi:hypothetical protein